MSRNFRKHISGPLFYFHPVLFKPFQITFVNLLYLEIEFGYIFLLSGQVFLSVFPYLNPNFSNASFFFLFQIEYVFQESGMAKMISATNITLGHLNPGSVGTSKNAEIYFGQLSRGQVRELHFKYRVDFEMFDYAIEPYLSYAKDHFGHDH